MTDAEAAYAAGIIDGEGSIMLGYRDRGERFKTLEISVASTSLGLLNAVMGFVGAGNIYKKKVYSEKHTQSFAWRLRGSLQCVALCRRILPFLNEESKLRRAKKILSEWSMVTLRNGRYNEAGVARKLKFELEFALL